MLAAGLTTNAPRRTVIARLDKLQLTRDGGGDYQVRAALLARSFRRNKCALTTREAKSSNGY